MLIGIAKTAKGVITLPDELRNTLGNARDVLVVQQTDGLFLKRIDPPRPGGLLEISDKLIALNETKRPSRRTNLKPKSPPCAQRAGQA